MGLRKKLPGMRADSGHRKRNIVVGIVYVFVALSVLGTLASASGFDVMGTDIVAPDTDSDSDAPDGGGEEATAMENESNSGSDTDSASAPDTTAEDIAEDSDEEEVIEAAEPDAGAAAVEDGQSGDSELTPAEMESRLNTAGHNVEVADENGEIVVDYYATSPDEEEVASDIGAIAGAYAAMVDSGYETDRMVVVVHPPVGGPVGETSVEAEDAQAYADGEISDDEYGKILIDSAEAYD